MVCCGVVGLRVAWVACVGLYGIDGLGCGAAVLWFWCANADRCEFAWVGLVCSCFAGLFWSGGLGRRFGVRLVSWFLVVWCNRLLDLGFLVCVWFGDLFATV